MVKPKEALVTFIVSPTFMLRIWHKCSWLKERFGSPNLWSGGSWKSLVWLAYEFINKISLSFCISCVNVLVHLWSYGCYILVFSVSYMLVISMVYDTLWL